VREAQTVGDRTPYENYLIERLLGQAAAAAGEPSIAARAFENVATSPASPEGERRQFLAAAASQYYLMKNYAKPPSWLRAISETAARKVGAHDLRPGAVPRQRTSRAQAKELN